MEENSLQEGQELSKFFQQSEIREVMRSQIHFSDYNPRKIDDEARRTLKRSLKLYGVVGGIIVNGQTANTIVGGHQKVAILDDIMKYDPQTEENDYLMRVEVVDMDLKKEKELNLMLNNRNAMGVWDVEKLRTLVPDVDYKNAGLTDADLSLIGLDHLFKTEKENDISDALGSLMAPVEEQHHQELEERQRQREEIRAAQEEANLQQAEMDSQLTPEEMERQARIDHMKDVKQQVKEGAISNAQDAEAYIMLSFDDFQSKKMFCDEYGLDPYNKFVKGEHFHRLMSGVLDDEE